MQFGRSWDSSCVKMITMKNDELIENFKLSSQVMGGITLLDKEPMYSLPQIKEALKLAYADNNDELQDEEFLRILEDIRTRNHGR